MKHTTTCDRCGCPVEVEYSEDDIKSMESFASVMGDWRKLKGRCDRCQRKVDWELTYHPPKPMEQQAPANPPKPLSEEEVRAQLPLKTLVENERNFQEEDEEAGYFEPDLL